MRIMFAVLFCCIVFYITPCHADVYYYHFPIVESSWGAPTTFNNLSPGFFQIMFRDSDGTVRMATYGIAGPGMDSLRDPQLLMLFIFDKKLDKFKLIKKY